MQTNEHPADDLSDLERRLSGWKPSAEGLDLEGMLCAAGRAAARPNLLARLAWPTAAGGLLVLAVALGLAFRAERSERLALAEQLRHATSPAAAPAYIPTPIPDLTTERPGPDSYLALHRALEKGVESWPQADLQGAGSAPSSGPPHVMSVRQIEEALGP